MDSEARNNHATSESKHAASNLVLLRKQLKRGEKRRR
jgi:hypothetical protein